MRAILSFVICFSVGLVLSYEKECHTENLNDCLLPPMIAANRKLIPEDEKALEKRCDLVNKSFKCAHNFMERCFSDLHFMLYDLATEHSRMIHSEWCQKGSKFQQEFLKISRCLNSAVKKTHQVCLKNVQSAIYQVMGDDAESRVPTGCCHFMQFHKCFYDQVEKSCGKESFPIVEKASTMVGMVMVENFCNSFDPSSELCQGIMSKNVTSASGKYSHLARFAVSVLKHRS